MGGVKRRLRWKLAVAGIKTGQPPLAKQLAVGMCWLIGTALLVFLFQVLLKVLIMIAADTGAADAENIRPKALWDAILLAKQPLPLKVCRCGCRSSGDDPLFIQQLSRSLQRSGEKL